MPSELLKQTLYSNLPQIELSLGISHVRLYTADSATCSIEPCLNFQQCLSQTKFQSASAHFQSSPASTSTSLFDDLSMLQFRSIRIHHDFSCRCPTGFTGTNVSVTCDLEINLCYSNPCREHGECVSVESGYVCVCERGWTGRACEFSLSEHKCCSVDSASTSSSSSSSTPTTTLAAGRFVNTFDRIR